MLSTSDLAAMRTTLEVSLPESVGIGRRSQASDGAGGYTDTWSTVASVAGRVSPGGLTPQERAIAERLVGVQTWTITLPALTDVRAADRLIVGSRTLEVVGVLAPRSYELCTRCVCVEIK